MTEDRTGYDLSTDWVIDFEDVDLGKDICDGRQGPITHCSLALTFIDGDLREQLVRGK